VHRSTIVRFLIAAAGAACLTIELAAQAVPMQKLRVAVMDLSGSALKLQATTMQQGPPQPPYGQPQQQTTTVTIAIPPPAEFARGLTEMLTSVLVKTGRFTVLERAAMQQLEQEQGVAAAGKTTAETGARQGALLGAQALITGDITGFAYDKSSLGGSVSGVVRGLSVASEMVSAEVIIDLRLVDASTGEVLYAAKGEGKASAVGVAADLVRDDREYGADAMQSTPLGQASRQAIQKGVVAILLGMPKVRWSGRIIDVRNGVVYVNAAAADGMRPGLELDVFAPQEALVDPETGKRLGAPEELVGTIVVESVKEAFSTARIVTQGIVPVRGQVVRFREEAKP
jgi:curli biogenesis system outer membrane secretion channel CsgG